MNGAPEISEREIDVFRRDAAQADDALPTQAVAGLDE
jgi:hypothetical protein